MSTTDILKLKSADNYHDTNKTASKTSIQKEKVNELSTDMNELDSMKNQEKATTDDNTKYTRAIITNKTVLADSESNISQQGSIDKNVTSQTEMISSKSSIQSEAIQNFGKSSEETESRKEAVKASQINEIKTSNAHPGKLASSPTVLTKTETPSIKVDERIQETKEPSTKKVEAENTKELKDEKSEKQKKGYHNIGLGAAILASLGVSLYFLKGSDKPRVEEDLKEIKVKNEESKGKVTLMANTEEEKNSEIIYNDQTPELSCDESNNNQTNHQDVKKNHSEVKVENENREELLGTEQNTPSLVTLENETEKKSVNKNLEAC